MSKHERPRRRTVANGYSLANIRPDLNDEWDYERNGDRTPHNTAVGCGDSVGWVCARGHRYLNSPVNRTERGQGCPTCARQDKLAARAISTDPLLRDQWHPILNLPLTPETTLLGHDKNVWWRCADGHDFEATPDNRSRGRTGCPVCLKRTVTLATSLVGAVPAIAAEYHRLLNEVGPEAVHPGSEVPRYWQCAANRLHVWRATPASRTRPGGTGCPVCNKGGWTMGAVRGVVLAMVAEGELLDQLTDTERTVVFHRLGLLDTSDPHQHRLLVDFSKGGIGLGDLYLGCGGDPEELERVRRIVGAGRSAGRESTVGLPAAPAEEGAASSGLPTLEDDAPFQDDGPEDLCAVLAPLDSDAIQAVTEDTETLEYLLASRLNRLWAAVDATVQSDRPRVLDALLSLAVGEVARRARDRFIAEYRGALELPVPHAWPADRSPLLMQRLCALRVLRDRRVANWSGTGAGKTLGALYAVRLLEVPTTVIFCPNAVVDTWVDEITRACPTAQISTRTLMPRFAGAPPDGQVVQRFVVANYEQLQQPASRQRLEHLLETTGIGCVIVDELHFVKQRADRAEASQRNRLLGEFLVTAAERQPALAVVAMTATPVMNDLREAVSLLELVTAQRYPELGTRPTVANAYVIHSALARFGMRMSGPRVPFAFRTPEVDATHLTDQLVSMGPVIGLLDIDRLLTRARIPAIVAAIAGPTLVYTHYVTGIVEELVAALRAAGHSVGTYTGDNKTGLEQFKAGRIEVLVASAPISTGVNLLQHVSHNLVINCPPWTASELEQLIGRLARQGQTHPVTVTVPCATIDVDGERWSWDRARLERLAAKRKLAAAAVDGEIFEECRIDQSLVLGRMVSRLAKLIECGTQRLVHPREQSGLVPQRHSREALAGPIRSYPEFSRINQRLNATHSTTTHQRLVQHPELHHRYHDLLDERRAHWAIDPAMAAAEACRSYPGARIADMGCGREPRIANALAGTHTVYSFDHVDSHPGIIRADISAVPLDDASVDIVVLSQALMGSNHTDYLREAHRILVPGGRLVIWEATGRIPNGERALLELECLGFCDVELNPYGRLSEFRARRGDRVPPAWAKFTLGRVGLEVVA